MISPARWAAFEALRRADTRGAAGQDLASALAGTRTLVKDPRDRALATELALGVERWRAALDAVIGSASGRETESIDFPALLSLRLAVFQFRHLTRTPPHAVVDDAVEIVRRAGAQRAAGFVNGVLRGLLRSGTDKGLPPRPVAADSPDAWVPYLTTTLSHPEWLVRRWIARIGPEAAEAWALFDNAPAPLTLRVNTRRMSVEEAQRQLAAEGIETTGARHAPRALVAERGNPMSTSLHEQGLVTLMEESSQLVGALAASIVSGRVLDACSAPGGKTLVLACDLPADSSVVAADRRPRRIELLRRSLARFGLSEVPVVMHDLARGIPFSGLDAVFVDAPCSGLGTIRRDPDVRWRRREAELPALADAQRRMLAQAATAVRIGGRIVYATCSSEPDENDAVVDAFLAEHPAFRRETVTDPTFAPFLDARGDFRTEPHRHGLEAFYAAALTRA